MARGGVAADERVFRLTVEIFRDKPRVQKAAAAAYFLHLQYNNRQPLLG